MQEYDTRFILNVQSTRNIVTLIQQIDIHYKILLGTKTFDV